MMKIQGTFTALISPFVDNVLDEEGLAQNIHFQIDKGIHGLVVLGTTGEAATLSKEEQERVISIAVQEANGKVPVWVGTGSNCTRTTIAKTARALDLGANGALIVTPYYNKPTQEGIFLHFEAIASAVPIPIIVYNIPSRTGANIETSTLERIAAIPYIVGVKECSGNLVQTAEIIHSIGRQRNDFAVLSGDDLLAFPMISLGASGLISVASNLIPAEVSTLVNAALEGSIEKAREIHFTLFPLFKSFFIETNPIPIKAAMAHYGMPAGNCRLPLTKLSPDNECHLLECLKCLTFVYRT